MSGLKASVQQFFRNLIFKALDAKIEAIRSVVDNEMIKSYAVHRLCQKAGVPNIPEEWRQLEADQAKIEQRKTELSKIGRDVLEYVIPSYKTSYYHSVGLSDLVASAESLYGKELLEECYPGVAEKVAKIEKTKENVEGTILLATSEQKLREQLVSLLKYYGADADFPELKEVLERFQN